MRLEDKEKKNAAQRKKQKTQHDSSGNFTLCGHRQPIITPTARPWLDSQPPVASHIPLLDVYLSWTLLSPVPGKKRQSLQAWTGGYMRPLCFWSNRRAVRLFLSAHPSSCSTLPPAAAHTHTHTQETPNLVSEMMKRNSRIIWCLLLWRRGPNVSRKNRIVYAPENAFDLKLRRKLVRGKQWWEWQLTKNTHKTGSL